MTANRTPLRGAALAAGLTLTLAGAAFAQDAATPSGTSPNGSANPTLREGPVNPALPQTPPDVEHPTVPDLRLRTPGPPGSMDAVIPPPPTGDHNVLPPPDAGASRTPVIPPPGSPGGNPNVQPK